MDQRWADHEYRQNHQCGLHLISKCFFLVFVSVPPSVTTRPSNKTVIENTMVAFACSASGNPVPKLTWVKDGESIRMGGKLSFKAARNDSGLYWCLADNGLQPAANSSALLDVQCEWYTPIKKGLQGFQNFSYF